MAATEVHPTAIQGGQAQKPGGALQALRLAAMALPGLSTCLAGLSATAQAEDAASLSLMHEHYSEGARNLNGLSSKFQPIQVDSLLGQARFNLTDDLSASLNLSQDTWSGATPVATAPSSARGNRVTPHSHTHTTTGASVEAGGHLHDAEEETSPTPVQTLTGASPYLYSQLTLDSQLRPLQTDSDGKLSGGLDRQLVHTLSSASPEVRQQFDLDVKHRGPGSSLSLGGGLSQEHDFTALFGHARGSWDFNRKRTSLGAGLSYTQAKTDALLDHDAVPHVYEPYMLSYERRGDDTYNRTHRTSRLDLTALGPRLSGERTDWGVNLSLSQILNPSAYLTADLGFTHSLGYQSNPYKAVEVAFIDPLKQTAANPVWDAELVALMEQRPDLRNQSTFNLRYVQYISATNAALHLNLRTFGDTWGIRAHSLDAQWVQPLGQDWTVTPRLRYYSQSPAHFYTPYLVSEQGLFTPRVDATKGSIYLDSRATTNGLRYYEDLTGTITPALDTNPASRKYGQKVVGRRGGAIVELGSGQAVADQSLVDNLKQDSLPFDRDRLPQHYSSDARLARFGTLSAGLLVSRTLTRGLQLDLSYEHLRRASSLALGGGDEAYADFAAQRINLNLSMALGPSALFSPQAPTAPEQPQAHEHSKAPGNPAGVQFDHLLAKGQWMLSYRQHHQQLSGDIHQGGAAQSDYALVNRACQGKPCYVRPKDMHMAMHMLDIMYAPTDWLSLMLMPQFMDMTMDMRLLADAPRNGGMDAIGMAITHAQHRHTSSGLGDTQVQGLFKLAKTDNSQLLFGLGLSAPTGKVNLSMRPMMGLDMGRLEYGMQLGSGTWDLLPSLTLSGETHLAWPSPLYWGAQISATHRLEERNSAGYALGDIIQGSLWGSIPLNHSISASLRAVYTDQEPIKGAYTGTHTPIGPGDYPSNYGGVFQDLGIGISASIAQGPFTGMQFALEWLQPVADTPAGYQLERQGSLQVKLGKHF
ncbi:MAG: DUF3570 domain-containing protein [Marinagarivorans sp.]